MFGDWLRGVDSVEVKICTSPHEEDHAVTVKTGMALSIGLARKWNAAKISYQARHLHVGCAHTLDYILSFLNRWTFRSMLSITPRKSLNYDFIMQFIHIQSE